MRNYNIKYISENFRKQGYYQKSLEIFEGYDPGVNIIGKPYKIRKLHLGDGSNYTDGLQAKVSQVTICNRLELHCFN